MKAFRRMSVYLVGMFLLSGIMTAQGVVFTWTGAASPDWFTDSNWSPVGVPQAGDAATIPAAATSPLLTHSTASLEALTISSGTLTCENWDTVINATNITVQNTGKITLPDAFANSDMSNRVHIVCATLTVNSGGIIDANEKGYGVGSGPGVGGGSDRVGGGGYGGRGGYASFFSDAYPGAAGGPTYGSVSAPTDPGSGSPICFSGSTGPGKGGGAILIEATNGTVIINGTLTANGGDTKDAHGGGGSGGSIYIYCGDFQGGLSGLISAQGGKRGEDDLVNGGAGGGGRIALIYQTCNLPSIRLSAARGVSYFTAEDESFAAQMGSVYLSTADILTPVLTSVSGRLIIPGVTTWSPASLVVSNCSVNLGDSFQLNVGGDLVVIGATSQLRLGMGSTLNCSNQLMVDNGKLLVDSGSTVTCNSGTINGGTLVVKGNLNCGTDFTVTNSGSFYAYSSTNDGTAFAIGSRVVVAGTMQVVGSSVVYPCSEPVNGGSPVFQVMDMIVDATAGFNAVGRGYGVNQGPGTATLGGADNSSGGGHGGKGGMGSNGYTPGSANGSSNAPVEAGSGSGNCYYGLYQTGKGGGVIWLEVAGTLTLDGALNASGGSAIDAHGAGGAGGSILVIARRFASGGGSSLLANGGNGGANGSGSGAGGGGGGGGRIALWVGYRPASVYKYVSLGHGAIPEEYTQFMGTISVNSGWGYYNGSPNGAEPGTALLLLGGDGPVLMFR